MSSSSARCLSLTGLALQPTALHCGCQEFPESEQVAAFAKRAPKTPIVFPFTIKCSIAFIDQLSKFRRESRPRGNLQDGRGVRRGNHLPPHRYIRNTSTCGTAPTEHLPNAGRRPQMSQKDLCAPAGHQACASEVGESSSGHWSTRDLPAPRNIKWRELSQRSPSQH